MVCSLSLLSATFDQEENEERRLGNMVPCGVPRHDERQKNRETKKRKKVYRSRKKKEEEERMAK